MGHRYPGTADLSYKDLIRTIEGNTRLSQKKRDELIEQVDILVGHMIADLDFRLRNQYGTYYTCGSKYLNAHRWYLGARDALVEASAKTLSALHSVRESFEKAGYRSRV